MNFIVILSKINQIFVIVFVSVTLLLIRHQEIHCETLDDSILLCTDEFCNSYRVKNPCPDLDKACRVVGASKNSTGTIFPSATPCNCCDTCLIHLKQGEDCSLGAPGSPAPRYFCGPGLKCQLTDDMDSDSKIPKCLPNVDTECTREQLRYDKAKDDGTLGQFMHRPECDEDGFYKAVKCLPGQICYCVDKYGQRIFGEALHTANTVASMNCQCSRISSTLNSLIKSRYPQYSVRCLDDGSFDPMHCVDDKCICLNSTDGTVTKNKIYNVNNGSGGGNGNSNSYGSADNNYGKNNVGATISIADFNKLPCFDRLLHNHHKYLHDCESIELEKIKESMESERNGYLVLDSKIQLCEPNGWYRRVQRNRDKKICVDKYGSQIENFQVDLNLASAATMNCNCARTREVLRKKQFIELPECCPNGNYKKNRIPIQNIFVASFCVIISDDRRYFHQSECFIGFDPPEVRNNCAEFLITFIT